MSRRRSLWFQFLHGWSPWFNFVTIWFKIILLPLLKYFIGFYFYFKLIKKSLLILNKKMLNQIPPFSPTPTSMISTSQCQTSARIDPENHKLQGTSIVVFTSSNITSNLFSPLSHRFHHFQTTIFSERW